MIDKIDLNQINKFLEKPATTSPNIKENSKEEKLDASLQLSYAELIKKAKQPESDAALVQKARKLIETGQLETRQNIKEAAENIIKLGI